MYSNDEKAICRGCGLILDGKPYYTGQSALHPKTKKQVKSCYYGGFVCCKSCDIAACLEQENSFPGTGRSTSLSAQAARVVKNNWGNHE